MAGRRAPAGIDPQFAAGIGLFLTFVGLNEAGIVRSGVPDAPVRIGNLASLAVLIAIFSFLAIAVLTLRRVPGAILLGILAASIVAFVSGIAPGPGAWIGTPPNPAPIMFKADLSAVLNFRFFGVLVSTFVMALIDTMGSLIGVSSRAGFLDERGNLPRIAQPMLCDALAPQLFAALAATTDFRHVHRIGGGRASGGRTGLTAVFIAALFVLSHLFAPLVTAIPPGRNGPALVIIGSMMMAPIAKSDFDGPTESIPAFAVVALISFTCKIGVVITAGLGTLPDLQAGGGSLR